MTHFYMPPLTHCQLQQQFFVLSTWIIHVLVDVMLALVFDLVNEGKETRHIIHFSEDAFILSLYTCVVVKKRELAY